MNVANVWNARNGKGTQKGQRAKGQSMKHEAGKRYRAKFDRNGCSDENGCEVCKEQKRAAPQCCMSANNVHAHEYTTHTIKLHTHENILHTYTQIPHKHYIDGYRL